MFLSSDFDIQILRKYIRENLIFDFLKKKDYQLIEEIIGFINTRNNEKNKWKNNEKECIINEKTTNKKKKFQNKTGGLRNELSD